MKQEAPLRARLTQLAEEYGLPVTDADRFARLLDELAAEPSSVTTVRDPQKAAEIHIADSLSGLALPALRSASSIADLGAGGGFPGLVLAIALPHASVSLVESVGRKCAFIDRAAERAQIGNATAVHARAEEWTEGIGSNDLVTARALAPLGVILEYAAPLLRDGGHLVAYKGHRDPGEETAAEIAARELGMELVELRGVEATPAAGQRHLYSYVKARPTPSRFPRRAGMARKRPLGAIT